MPAKNSKTVAKAFGLELRKARTQAGYTQQVLAERVEVDPVFISFLENGHRQPSLAVLLAIDRVLGLAAGELASRVGKQMASPGAKQKKSTLRQTSAKRSATLR